MIDSKARHASFVGTLPGPVTGMTVSTEEIIRRLRSKCQLREIDLGRSYRKNGTGWRLKKMWFSLQAAAQILVGRRRPEERLYLTLNSTAGLAYNLLHILAARARGFQLILHHHVYNYIEVPDVRMKSIIRLAGPQSIHVVACQQMADDLEQLYGVPIQALVSPPAKITCGELPDGSQGRTHRRDRFTTGHLSNLSSAKGLREVLATFERVVAAQPSARLVLAGPCHNPSDLELIDAAVLQHPQHIEYLGPVYDGDKQAFFASIDAFLFPTKMESWGIVLNEALAAGVPVISVRRACIPCLVGTGGTIVEIADDFESVAAAEICSWIDDPVAWRTVAAAAAVRGSSLETEIEAAMQKLVEVIAGDAIR